MQIDDVLHDAKTDTCTRLLVLCLEKGLKEAATVFLTNTYAIVANHDAEMLTIGIYLT